MEDIIIMKKFYKGRRLLASLMASMLAVVLGLAAPAAAMTALAVETVNVSGTVAAGTTDDLLLLSTSDGIMQIKMDNSTDLSQSRVLYNDKQVIVTVYRGDDAFMHATKIVSGATVTEKVNPTVKVDTSNPVTVTGTVEAKSTSQLIRLNTDGATMLIKVDQTTDTTGCRAVMVGTKISVSVGHGEDGYMHALKITNDGASTNVNSSNIRMVGLVGSETNSEWLYLEVGNTKYPIHRESSTDYSQSKLLLPGKAVTVDYYKSSDNVLHAVRVIDGNATSNSSASSTSTSTNTSTNTNTSSSSSTSTSTTYVNVTGTVQAYDSNTSVCSLSTAQGVMLIKLDANPKANAVNTMVAGLTITAAVYRGNDGYMHAAAVAIGTTAPTVSGSGSSSSTSTNTNTSSGVTYINVTGTVQSYDSAKYICSLKTNEGVMLIKLDDTPRANAVNTMVGGLTITAAVYRGNDGYMHAAAINIGTTAPTVSGSGSGSGTNTSTNPGYVDVTGTIGSDTSSTILHLQTDGSTMLIKMDANTNQGPAKILIPGNKVTVSIYNGGDGYMHAATIKAGYKLDADVKVSIDGAIAVNGTVVTGTDANMICLDMGDGAVMKAKLDTTTNYSKCRVVKIGKAVTISVVRGSDEYMHIVAIAER